MKRFAVRIVPLVIGIAPAAAGCTGGKTAPAPSTDGGDIAASTTASAGASTSDGASAPAPVGSNAGAATDALPVVDLHGDAHPRAASEAALRITSIAMVTNVVARPDPSAKRIGTLRAGASVEALPEPQGKAGCPGGWRAIRPRGFVCLGDDATLDREHPIARAARPPDLGQKLPYMYGVVTRGGPVYARVPTADDLARFEPTLATHLEHWKNDDVSGAKYGLELWMRGKSAPPVPAIEALEKRITDESIPWFLKDHQTAPNLAAVARSADAVKIGELSRRNGIAFIDSFLFEGRRYAVSTDLRIAPADRFRPIRGSDFHGVEIGKDVDFPFALVRRKGAKRWEWDAAKRAMKEAGELEWRSAVALTGKQRFEGGVLHYEAKDGSWVDDQHAGRVDPAKKMPGWGKKGEKWIDINVTKQILVAYEGTKAVYATLVSTGEAGLGDPDKTRSTKRGIFRVHTKHVSVTMDSEVVGEEFELRDVPFVQYFEDGYALHGAYWHDGFGQPKSHGCVNLSPEDARRLFWWTEPEVPTGWHSAAAPLTGTVVFVHP